MDSDSESSTPPERYVEILGQDPSTSSSKGIPLNLELVNRWTSYLRGGLTPEDKEKLRSEWIVPDNCPALKAPELNPEIQALLFDPDVKKDSYLARIQSDLGAGMSALGAALNLLLADSKTNTQLKDSILPALVDCAKSVCVAHFQLSLHRRHQIYPKLKPSMHKVAKEAQADTFLFGRNLPEKCKAAQAITKSSLELKASARAKPFPTTTAPASSSANYLNFQRPAARSRFKLQNFTRSPRTYRKTTQDPRPPRTPYNRQQNLRYQQNR